MHDNSGDEQAQELVRHLRGALADRALSGAELTRLLSGSGPREVEASLEQSLRQSFEQAYVKTYSFAYDQATDELNGLIQGIQDLPPGPLRWEMFVKLHITLGIARDGAKDRPGALGAFATVLRTRPGLALPRREYSSRVIQLWEKARRRLGALPRGKLAVDSQPGDAQVILDGVDVGVTPFVGTFPRGRYHLQLLHQDGSSAEGWVELGAHPTRVSRRLLQDPRLEGTESGPSLSLPKHQSGLPSRWWAWLGRRLGKTTLLLVDRRCPKGACEFVLRVLDPSSGKTRRYARVRRISAPHLEQTAQALAAYLMDGKNSELLEPLGEKPADEPEAGQPLHIGQRHLVSGTVKLEPFADIQPWYRRWWPWAIGSAGLLALSVGAHVAHANYAQAADDALTVQGKDDNRALADFSLGLAITGYCLAGASLMAGLVLELTFDSPAQSLRVGPQGSQGLGIVWTGRF